jgi:sterol desaturase/sphingolipid hydroxylase (fatty acid hydroxylase superfamily)
MEQLAQFPSGKGVVLVLTFVMLFILERRFPAAHWFGGASRVVKNLVLAGFNFIASPLIVIPVSAWAAFHGLHWRPDWWSGYLGLGIDLLLLDLWIYWWHRANHVLPFLWRFHEVHHLDEMLDTTSALRFHFGEVVLSSLVRAVVIFILAVPLTSVVVFETLVLVSALFHHSNVKLPSWFERVLGWIVVTPAIHWVHHHAIRRDTDSNYSTILSIWDRLFASCSLHKRSADMKIGVEDGAECGLPGLIVRPFHR